MAFKILTWNVNGLRSFKQTLKEFLDDLHSEIICLQETKITRDMLTEDLAIVEGYSSYFAFSRRRSGYSGVATYAKNCCLPVFATEGLCGTLPSSISACSALPLKETVDNGTHQVLSDIIQAATCELQGAMDRSELRELDCEGRAVITIHNIVLNSSCAAQKATKPLAIINVYCPRADPAREDRALYKLQFYRALRHRAALLHGAGAAVVVLGDVNTSHGVLDHCDPDVDFHLSPGRKFLDEFLLKLQVIGSDAVERLKLETTLSQSNSDDKEIKEILSAEFNKVETVERKTDDHDLSVKDGKFAEMYTTTSSSSRELHDSFQMVDTFRYLYPHRKDAFTCWNTKANARETNYGTRIDYIFCDKHLLPYVKDSLILQDVMGSDHCPVVDIVECDPLPARVAPDYCTKNFAEFQGQQQKLWSYFQKKEMSEKNCVAVDKNLSQFERNVIHENLPDVCSSNELPSKSFYCKGSISNFIVKNVHNTESASGSLSASKFVKTPPGIKEKANGKRKSTSSGNHCSKRQQSNLLTFFGTNKSKGSKCANEMLRSPKNKSLYESELLFLKSNPSIYEKLTSSENGLVDMEIFTKASQSSNSDSSIVTSVKCQNSNVEHLEYSQPDATVNTEHPPESEDESESSSPFIFPGDQDISSSGIISDQEQGNKPLISSQSQNWAFMNQKLEVPLCSGHREPCVLRTTKKKGLNFNRRFFACCRGVGRPGQKDAQCGYFKWI